MFSNLIKPTLVAVAVTATLSGCGIYGNKQEVLTGGIETTKRIQSMTAEATMRVKDNSNVRTNAQDVAAPWIAGKSVALAKEVSVPKVLRLNVRTTMLSPQCVNASDITVVAGCITEATGVPVRVKADAKLPQSLFAPRPSVIPGVAAAPRPVELSSQVNAAKVFTPEASDVPLTRLLDTISAVYAVSYRLANDGALEFYRLDTRTFRIKALAQKLSSKTTQTTGFDGGSSTTFEIKDADAVDAVGKTLLSMGTQAGNINVSRETLAITMTDTPEVLDRVAKYVETENKHLTRRVTLVVDQIYVSAKDNREFSLDWNLVYGALNLGTSTSNTYKAPGSLASDSAGSFGFSKLSGRFTGTSLVVKALAEQGLIVQQRSFPLSTQNGSPVSVGLPTIFDYVQEVTFTQITGNSLTSQAAPTVKQKEERVGTYLTVTPEAQDDGQIIVSTNFQDRTGTLNPYTVSAGGFSSTIQQRNIDELSNIGRTVVRVGVPTIIGGLSERIDSSKERRLDDNAPIILGGSDAIKRTKRSMILLVTAIAEDGV